MKSITADILPIREGLLRVGFSSDRLRPNVPIPDQHNRLADLLAFSESPFDSRTAMVAVVRASEFQDPDISTLRPLGAPLVFQCYSDHYLLWKQGTFRPHVHSHLTPQQLPRFFEENKLLLAPDSIYRAKVWGRLDKEYQLDFVDIGFFPLIEEQAGQKLIELVVRAIGSVRRFLHWDKVSEEQGRWLLQSVFWLLAAKILRDKSVPGFIRLDLRDFDQVFSKLARHYDSTSPRPVRPGGAQRREALGIAAEKIAMFGNCGCVSTEALSCLYENAMIDRATRQQLGTHSTPTWLVDYIVGRLRPWIQHDISVELRRVFEPACGHAAFLISAMRLLSELLPDDWLEPRKTYLRKRLHGIELDPFALEIARLSLTLADVPNPNGWTLTEGNIFAENTIDSGVRAATIVLGNPPFEPFKVDQRPDGALRNKAAEAFRRVVNALQPGSVFGFVLPQTFLRASESKEVRDTLNRDFELNEVSLFADKVFREGDSETVVLIGRRLRTGQIRGATRYNRIREKQVETFRKTYQASSSVVVQFENGKDLYVPHLAEIWRSLESLPRLSDFALVGQGFDHIPDGDPALPEGIVKVSEKKRPGLVPGVLRWDSQQLTHKLPKSCWVNVSPKVVIAKRHGTVHGVPQLLLNYNPISREIWRLEALIDRDGHAASSNFNVLRPTVSELSLEVAWAICNSPVVNAYIYSFSGKRHVQAGDLRAVPVPDFRKTDLTALKVAVECYLGVASTFKPQANGDKPTPKQRSLFEDPELDEDHSPAQVCSSDQRDERARLKKLHLRIDAEVLRLYDLPPKLERRLLDEFSGVERRGVPFEQSEYFPRGFTDLDRLSEILAITLEWTTTNRRRAKLMDLDEDQALTELQACELVELQRLADARVSLLNPVQMDDSDRLIEDLKRRGLWTE